MQGSMDALEHRECPSGGIRLRPALLLQVVFLGVHRLQDLLQWWSAMMAIQQPGCVLPLVTETVAVTSVCLHAKVTICRGYCCTPFVNFWTSCILGYRTYSASASPDLPRPGSDRGLARLPRRTPGDAGEGARSAVRTGTVDIPPVRDLSPERPPARIHAGGRPPGIPCTRP